MWLRIDGWKKNQLHINYLFGRIIPHGKVLLISEGLGYGEDMWKSRWMKKSNKVASRSYIEITVYHEEDR